MVDWESLAEIVDHVDTQYAIDGKVSMPNLDVLGKVIEELRPYLAGDGSQEETTNALRLFQKIERMIGREIGGTSDDSESKVDTTTCHLCGQKYSGTPEELDEWELKHVKENHPNVRLPVQ